MRSVVVLGGSGLVGSRLVELWSDHIQLAAPSHADLDVEDHAQLREFMAAVRPDVVVNLAAWADVDGAEAERDDTSGRAYGLNVVYPARLAKLCAEHDAYLLHVSTDYVFDGSKDDGPYDEDDPRRALCWYAETKLRGEDEVLQSGAAAAVVR